MPKEVTIGGNQCLFSQGDGRTTLATDFPHPNLRQFTRVTAAIKEQQNGNPASPVEVTLVTLTSVGPLLRFSGHRQPLPIFEQHEDPMVLSDVPDNLEDALAVGRSQVPTEAGGRVPGRVVNAIVIDCRSPNLR